MLGLIQRVSHASVKIEGVVHGEITSGILLLLGIQRDDTTETVQRLLHKCLNYRIFADAAGKMNLSLEDTGGGLLIVSQFTLAADTRKGLRPSFSNAAPPDMAAQLYADFVAQAQAQHAPVASGIFAADMQIDLCNDGPVTFLLEAG